MKISFSILVLLSNLMGIYAQDCDDFTNVDNYPEASYSTDEIVGYSQGGIYPIVHGGEWLMYDLGIDVNRESYFDGLYIIGGSALFEFDGGDQVAIFECYGWVGPDTEEGFTINGSDTIYLDAIFPMTVDGIVIDRDDSAPTYESWDTYYLSFSGNLDNITLGGVEFGIKNLCIEDNIGDIGIESATLSAALLYPNPSHDYLEIKRDKKISTVEIYSLTGELLMSVEKINATQTRLNIEALENGAYFVQVIDKSGSKTATRFLKN